MYKKPVVIETEDLAEGVYTASGSGNATATKEKIEYNPWSKQATVTFTVTIPSESIGQHIKVTVVFDQAPVNAWGSVSDLIRNGETINYEVYSASASHDITAVVNASDVNIVAVKVGNA